MSDIVVVALLVVGFALLVTVHVTIVVGLFRRTTKGRALLAFLVAPIAPVFAWQERMRVRAVLWVVALLLYVVAFFLGHRAH